MTTHDSVLDAAIEAGERSSDVAQLRSLKHELAQRDRGLAALRAQLAVLSAKLDQALVDLTKGV